MPLLLDTGVVYALADADDAWHGPALECLGALRETLLVPVTVRIPIGDLVLVPDAGSHVAQISVFSVVRDARGGMSDVSERSYPIEIANDKLSSVVGQPFEFVLGMVLRGGPHRIAVSVRDDHSSIESTGFVDVVVGAADEGATG